MAALRGGHPVGTRLRANDSFAPADAGALGGRVKPGHDKRVGARAAVQKITSGLTGEPVPPSTGIGAKVIRNS